MKYATLSKAYLEAELRGAHSVYKNTDDTFGICLSSQEFKLRNGEEVVKRTIPVTQTLSMAYVYKTGRFDDDGKVIHSTGERKQQCSATSELKPVLYWRS